MAIYVDELRRHPTGLWSHMMCNGDVSELHEFAQRIGLRRNWFQDGRNPHYDLRPSKRTLAIQHGAVAVSSVEMVKRCSTLPLFRNGDS